MPPAPDPGTPSAENEGGGERGDLGPRPIVAIIPAYNEAESIATTVAALAELVDRLVVVDDCSSDGTAAAAAGAGVEVVVLERRTGKGGAVAEGLARAPEAATYLLIDADVGATASEAAKLLDRVRADDDVAMAIGVLPAAGGRGGFGLVRDLARAGIRRATSRAGAAGFEAQAPLSGQRAIDGALLRSLELTARFGLEVGLTIDVIRAGRRVVEVPVAMEHRHTGRSAAGFAHRGRQGLDVVRALWPRLTSTRARRGMGAVVLLVLLGGALWSGSNSVPDNQAFIGRPRPSKVLIFGMAGVGWDDLTQHPETLPNLSRLAGTGAVAALNVRTGSPTPLAEEGYATLGAGTRVRVSSGAAQAWPQAGRDRGSQVADPSGVRDEAGRHLSTRPGALGEALRAAGLRTAVVGNADTASGLFLPADEVDGRHRPGTVALMGRDGFVDAGTVDPSDLLVAEPTAAYGLRADPERVAAETRRALGEADVVLVDPGDLQRAAALTGVAPPGFADRMRARALTDTDAVLGRVMSDLPPDVLVLVVSVIPSGERWELTPIVMSGASTRAGHLYSPSTRRSGLVTLTDLAPTILQATGTAVPPSMIGRPLRSAGDSVDVHQLAGLNADAVYRERIYLPVAIGFIVVQALVYAGVAAKWQRRQAGSGGAQARRKELLRLGVLSVAAFPLATFVFRGLSLPPSWGPAGVLALLAVDGALVALVARARRHSLSALGWLALMTVVVIAVDVATGSRLQVASIFGYSPHTASRFYGLGNTGFALLAGAALTTAAIHLHYSSRPTDARWVVVALLVAVAVVDGAPTLGDDVGGMVTLVPVFALTLVAFWRRRLSWRWVAGALLLGLAVVALATTIDLLRPPDERTHLGRLAAETWQQGEGSLVTTVVRKAETNFRVLRSSVWTWAVPMIAGYLLVLLAWQRRAPRLLPPESPLRAGVVAMLAASLVGFAANDSGVVVTAIVLVYVATLVSLLALDDHPPPGVPELHHRSGPFALAGAAGAPTGP